MNGRNEARKVVAPKPEVAEPDALRFQTACRLLALELAELHRIGEHQAQPDLRSAAEELEAARDHVRRVWEVFGLTP